jgi:hypothetical protein
MEQAAGVRAATGNGTLICSGNINYKKTEMFVFS